VKLFLGREISNFSFQKLQNSNYLHYSQIDFARFYTDNTSAIDVYDGEKKLVCTQYAEPRHVTIGPRAHPTACGTRRDVLKVAGNTHLVLFIINNDFFFKS
jgi:hypothetical protein